MSIKTEEFVETLVAALGAMPPEGTFCKIVKGLAETSAWSDKMEALAWQEKDTWGEDKKKVLKELTDKFGDDIDLEELYKEWSKQAG